MTPQLDRPEPDHRNAEIFGENRVEFGDSARPGIEVVTGDAVDHRVGKLVGERSILPDRDTRRNTAIPSSGSGQKPYGHVV